MMTIKQQVIYLKRSCRDSEETGRIEPFAVPVEGRVTVLQALQYIYENLDSTIAFEYYCRYAKCGICGLEINGRPGLACTVFLRDEETVLAPLSNLPVVRDLVVDRSPMEKLLRDEEIFFKVTDLEKSNLCGKVHDGHFFKPVKISPGFETLSSCFECLCCHAACSKLGPSGKRLDQFAGPYIFVKLAQLHLDPRDKMDRKAQAHRLGINECSDCRRCYCPQGIPIYRLAVKPFLG